MRRIFILTLFITIFSSLSAMQAPEAIQDNDEAACNWATELCTEQFLTKAKNFACYKMLMHGEPSCNTKDLNQEEKDLLTQLVQHNQWSYELHKKINQQMPVHFDAQVIYLQIIYWAFGEESLEFNNEPHYTYEVSKTNRSLEEILPRFILEHINLYRKNHKPFLFKMLKIIDTEVVSQLIEIGANPNARCTRTGNSALHELSYVKYYKELFQDKKIQQHYRDFLTLLTKYLDINVRNDLGQTPLHCAVGNMNFMKVLLAGEKVQINAQDKDGNTPLHMAAYFFDAREYEWWHGNDHIFIERKNDRFGTLLLLYGADRKIRNNYGLSYDDIIDAKRYEFRKQKQCAANRWRYRHLSDYPC